MTAAALQESMAWLTLGLVPRLSESGVHALVRRFGSATAAVGASRADWVRALGDGRAGGYASLGAARREAVRQCELARQQGVAVVPAGTPAYPRLLQQIDAPPPVLFVLGTLDPEALSVAIVGPRRASSYGLEVARMLGRQLAQHGVTVVSGMAAGVDAAAHRGALEGGGSTVAVLGCGVDVVYPAGHRHLHARIRDNGAVVSQFTMGARPVKGSFPRRNRLISGICTGVVVVEAPIRSGALITASNALQQGRDVFAVPGGILDGRNDGSNALLHDGATVVNSVDDILEAQWCWRDRAGLKLADMGASAPGAGSAPGADAAPNDKEVASPCAGALPLYAGVSASATPAAHVAEPEGEVPRRVLAALDSAPRSVDALAGATGLPVNELLAVLLELELGGYVRQWPGQQFARAPVRR